MFHDHKLSGGRSHWQGDYVELHTGQLGFYGRAMAYRVEPGVIEIHLGTASDDLIHVGDLMLTDEGHDGTGPEATKVFSGAVHIGP